MKNLPLLAAPLALAFLACATARAATVTYQFTGHSLAPALSGVPAGVTVSDFIIGSGFTLTDNGAGPDSIRFHASDVGGSSSPALTTLNQYVSFSVTIAAGTVVNFTSLSLIYNSTIPTAEISNSRVFSSIDNFDNIANDTIGVLGKASGTATGGPFTSSISLSSPEGNSQRGTNVTNGEFNNLTNRTVTFYLPWIDNDTGTNYTDVDDVTLTFDIVPEPTAAALGAVGLILLLRVRRA
ncbi:hypothetical protein OVA24_14300 [Luteolibacter sp. SL250]|uniref:hypothetical protein n=1 Tax=Luteolibacter sp. SL250 TaxID=2995170 RepID=UPI00226FCE9A|nr:hypothetical protein [Luteolibacter sp. SL250]WAC18402.1 hypothetical protein OVA24_14300 [Luteolibacter sp. SL250]